MVVAAAAISDKVALARYTGAGGRGGRKRWSGSHSGYLEPATFGLSSVPPPAWCARPPRFRVASTEHPPAPRPLATGEETSYPLAFGPLGP